MRIFAAMTVLLLATTSNGQSQESFLGQEYQVQVAPGSRSFPNSLTFGGQRPAFWLNQPVPYLSGPSLTPDGSFANSGFDRQDGRRNFVPSGGTSGRRDSLFSPSLARAPHMFGDSFAQGAQVRVFDGRVATGDLALAGGSRRAKIAENSKALTEDRVFVMYNHFRNAVEADASDFIVGPDRQSFSINRFTLGFEKTLLDGLFSVDVRLPVSDGYAFNTPNFGVSGGEAGNLAVSIKALLFATNAESVVAGVTIDLPTGSNAFGRANLDSFEIGNESTHLSPFVGMLRTPNSRVFQQLFVQVDAPVSSNSLSAGPLATLDSATLKDQILLYLDGAVGTWLVRKTDWERRRARRMTLSSLAASVEAHYTTTLNEAEIVPASTLFGVLEFGNLSNRQDIFNLTLGLHGELNNGTKLRVGGVFPIKGGDDRFFDSEVQIVDVG